MSQFYSDLLNWTTVGVAGAAWLTAALELPQPDSDPATREPTPILASRAAPDADPDIPRADLLPVESGFAVEEVTFATAEPDAGDGPRGVVTGQTVNLRAGPGTNHPVVDQARRGDRLPRTGETAGIWVEVRLDDGGAAWIHGNYFRAE